MSNKINEKISVSAQIPPSELEAVAALGFDTVMCNRPDGEEPAQPSVAEMEAEAKRLGMRFVHVPIQSGQVTLEAVEAFAQALENSSKLFAYCRTGTRSAMLWSLTQRGKLSADEILNATAQAGYDFSGMRVQLEA